MRLVEHALAVLESVTTGLELLREYNPNHDSRGRFAHKSGGGAASGGNGDSADKAGGGGGGGAARSFDTDAEGKAFINEHYGDWRQSLTPKEDAALAFYQSPGYQLMNGQARGLKLNAPEKDLARAKEATKNLDKAIDKAPPLTEPLLVHRGLDASQFGEVKAGDVVTDKGFTSVSLTKGSGTGGRDQATAIIRLPEGTKAAAGYTKELILPRNTRFKIISYVRNGKRVTYEMEVIVE